MPYRQILPRVGFTRLSSQPSAARTATNSSTIGMSKPAICDMFGSHHSVHGSGAQHATIQHLVVPQHPGPRRACRCPVAHVLEGAHDDLAILRVGRGAVELSRPVMSRWVSDAESTARRLHPLSTSRWVDAQHG